MVNRLPRNGFHSAIEIGVREPGGHIILFSQMQPGM